MAIADIAHPYKLLTSKYYIKYDDGFDGLYDSMYLLLTRAYLSEH